MGGLGRRIDRLAEAARTEALPTDWPLSDQFCDVASKLGLYQLSGPGTGCVTDRELCLLVSLHAYAELGGPGEFKLPSGAVVHWRRTTPDRVGVVISGSVTIEDLPEYVR